MIIKLIVFLVKLSFAGILLKDRKDEVKLWSAVCLIFAAMSEVAAYVESIEPSSPYLMFVRQVLVFLEETGMPYAFLMAGVAYLDLRSRRIKLWIGLLLVLPPVLTTMTLQDGLLRLDHPFFLAWCSAYLMGTVLLMLGKNTFTHGQPRRRKKVVELFIIIPNVLGLLIFHYLTGVITGWGDSVLVIVTLTFVLFIVVISRSGVLGIKLRLERQIAVGTLRALTTGTSLLNHSLKNHLTNIDLLANRIAARIEWALPDSGPGLTTAGEAVLKAEAEAAASENSTTDSRSTVQDVQLIRQEVEHLYEMIRRIQHRTESIELNEQPYSINELIRAAIDSCAQYQSEKKAAIRFRSEMHAVVTCDKVHLQEVFVNLLHNALDALSLQGGVIEIRMERAGRRLKLEFRDNGQGIAPEHLSKIWEPFFSTKAQQINFGLGLTYSMMVIEKHGGKLELESKTGQGATVRIRLPMRRVAALAGGLS